MLPVQTAYIQRAMHGNLFHLLECLMSQDGQNVQNMRVFRHQLLQLHSSSTGLDLMLH